MGQAITDIRAMLWQARSKDPLTTSLHPGEAVQTFLLVRLEAGGAVGIGECPVTPFITGETPHSALAAVNAHLAPALIGHDLRDIHGLHRRMRRALAEGNGCALSAIDLAAHDALGQALGVPASVLLGGVPRGPVQSSRAIGTGTTAQMVAAARRNFDAGYRTIKIKTGADDAAELDAIRAIRADLGPEVRLKLDANQGWTFARALRFLDRAAAQDIYVVEQPLAAGDLRGAAELRRRIAMPLMLDESVHTPADMLRALDAGACDFVNIKLLKAGGLYPAAQIAAIAAAAGIRCQIGTLSTSIGTAAAIHLIHAHPVIELAEINWPDRLEENPAAGFTMRRDMAAIPDAPGLGLAPEARFRDGSAFRNARTTDAA
jgi:L-alanine-DL-glutamate epimerase-like enolase superfamily enzyme